MTRGIKKRSKKAGLPPGTPVHIGEQKTAQSRLNVIAFDTEKCHEQEVTDVRRLENVRESSTVFWLNVDGVQDVALLEQIASTFQLHPLVLEDIANTDQRAKVEDYDNHLYIVIRQLSYDRDADEVQSEQVSLVLADKLLISFGEREGDLFNSVRERIRFAKGKIRTMDADYLLYRLIDAVVDHYFVVLEALGERIERLENQLVDDSSTDALQEIHRLKREIMFVRRSVWPLREVLGSLEHEESELIREHTEIYFRDVHDHTIQVIETVETYRDMMSGLMDLYQSNVNLRLNQVMKVLTVISTIFLPLTFLVGLWGMNFVNMPELYVQWGYFAALGLMALTALVMIIMFKKRNWL